MNEILKIKGLKKSYGKRTVLSVKELSIEKGSVMAIIGPSGAGKSTLLRIINRLETPSAGEIVYFGDTKLTDQSGNIELQRKMTMVFQKPTLLDRSVYDNIAFGLKARKFEKVEIEKRVISALQTIGLLELKDQKARTLSGGEAQRVAFARALVLDPEIILLDEPTANLDPANVGMLEALIRKINLEKGTTVVIVTHNLLQAKRLATHVAFFYDGNLLEYGDMHRVLDDPIKDKTRDFVEGRMIY
ncbi:phosphate ABC transporter ATP-binding protein [Alkalibacter sp. M17DMB]|nr:phosphate ABC transporter ATP-binding protein [Alkalibacter mobilis]